MLKGFLQPGLHQQERAMLKAYEIHFLMIHLAADIKIADLSEGYRSDNRSFTEYVFIIAVPGH